MALYFTSLNSGSNGNCYYIGNDSEAILVDTGISCKETEKRMLVLGLDMHKVKAIFISHEHSDHIKGLPVIAAKYKLPVYITANTYKKSKMQLPPYCLQWLRATEKVNIGSLCIAAFSKCHDAEDPHSFIITDNGLTVGVFTDIGVACSNVTKYFKRCHAAFLEANYDEAMLENGNYPYYLKNRIRGGQGHLSNTQALEIFKQHSAPFLSHLLLSHLSRDNNDPIAVQQLFERHALHTKIIVASRYEATEIFTLQHTGRAARRVIANLPRIPSIQISLFD
jgi:phosphoribosyl 1,2-cyclic phosphodiesterase